MRSDFTRVHFVAATFLCLSLANALGAGLTNPMLLPATNTAALKQAPPVVKPPTNVITTNAWPFPSPQKQERNRLIEIIDSKLVSSLIALAVGFLLAQGAERRKKRREEDKKYCCLLESTAQELTFYAEKLKFLSEQLDGYLKGLGVIPSYTFYPSFLEQAKLRLGEFMRRSELVREVGHCHFELGHICEKLVIFKKQAEDATSPQSMMDTNTRGFKGLVDSNIPVFQKTATALADEANAVKTKGRIK